MDNEDAIYLLKIIEVGLLASVKFVLSPFEAERQGFNFRDAFLITTSGGILGVIAFTYIGDALVYGWKKFTGLFKSHKDKKPGKKFTWTSKLTVRIKMKFGLLGLAITTPCLISIPVGTFMTHRFYRKKMRNVLFIITSLLIWSVLLNGLAQYISLSEHIHLPKIKAR